MTPIEPHKTSNVLAVLHPESRGMTHTWFTNDKARQLYLTDNDVLAAETLLDTDIDHLMVDTALLFREDFSALRWIMFVRPDMKVTFLN